MQTRRNILVLCTVGAAVLPASQRAFGLPTFQTYIEGAVAGTIGPDEETWFYTGTEFNLFVVGAYGSHDVSIDSVTLLLSVPQGETGTISITPLGGDEVPVLVTLGGAVSNNPLNPAKDADIDILSDNAGRDGYSTKNFLPDGASFNNHYPFQENTSDFVLFSIGPFDKSETGLYGYEAEDEDDDGESDITFSPNAVGEQKEYSVSFSGFSQVHFDVYGAVTDETGHKEIHSSWEWEINPGSHDATAVIPAPAALLLGILGLGLVVSIGRARCS